MNEATTPANPLQTAWEDLTAKHNEAKAKAAVAQAAQNEAQRALSDLSVTVEMHIKAIREAFKV
jgi:hypothetical protein